MNISRTALDSFPALRMGAEHVVNRADFERKFFCSKEKEKEGGKVGGDGDGDGDGGDGLDLDLVDTFRELHPQAKKYSYRPRKEGRGFGGGGDRVDMIIGSQGFVEGSIASTSSSASPPGKPSSQTSSEKVKQLEGHQKEEGRAPDRGAGTEGQAAEIIDDGTDAHHGTFGGLENHGNIRQGKILVEADICDCEEERAASDHVPIWVGLDLQRCYESEPLA